MNKLEVRASKSSPLLVGLLGALLVPLGLANLIGSFAEGLDVVRLGIGAMTLALFGAVVWLAMRGYRTSVRLFDEEGLVRNDGQRFSWADLTRVVDQFRIRPSGKKFLWRTEIQFEEGGAAWVIPSKVSNYAEVAGFVRSLPCEHAERRA